jgi:hypothetical protein
MTGYPGARSSGAQGVAEPVNAPAHAARITPENPAGPNRLVSAAHSHPIASPRSTAHRREQHINSAMAFQPLAARYSNTPSGGPSSNRETMISTSGLHHWMNRPVASSRPKFATASIADLASIRDTIVHVIRAAGCATCRTRVGGITIGKLKYFKRVVLRCGR